MLIHIPALEFIRHIVGEYQTKKEPMKFLKIWQCGYGVVFEIKSVEKSDIVAVVGIHQSEIECFAQVGLPNIIHMLGKMTSSEINFEATDPAIGIRISLLEQQNLIKINLELEDKVAKHYEFHPRLH